MAQSNEERKDQRPDDQKEIDVTRSQHRQAQAAANPDGSGEEIRPKGSVYKGNPDHEHGSHEEGQAPHQSDDPTMHPSGMDEDK